MEASEREKWETRVRALLEHEKESLSLVGEEREMGGSPEVPGLSCNILGGQRQTGQGRRVDRWRGSYTLQHWAVESRVACGLLLVGSLPA